MSIDDKLTPEEQARLDSIVKNTIAGLDHLLKHRGKLKTIKDAHRFFTSISEESISSVNLVEWLYSDKFGKDIDLADVYGPESGFEE